MLFKKINVLNENFEVEKDMYVVTEGAYIKYIGKKCRKETLMKFTTEKVNC